MKKKKINIFQLKFENSFRKKLNKGVNKILDEGFLSNHTFVKKFEDKFKKYNKSKYCVAVNSGTSALELIFRSINVQNKKVLIASNTFVATAIAAKSAGGIPIPVDIDKEFRGFCEKDLLKKIDKTVGAIVIVHIGGLISSSLLKIVKICKSKKIPLVDKIIVDIIVESQPKWLSFQKAKADLLEIPKDNFDTAVLGGKEISPELKSKGIRLFANAQLDVTFFAFNHDDPLFKNKKLRQAMSLAWNREEANKLFYNSAAVEAQSVIPPGLGGFRKEFKNPFIKFDLDLAKKLLAEAGYPGGKGLPDITIQTRNETIARQMIEHFAKNLEKIGIKIKIGMNTWPELVNKVTKRQHQMYTMAWGADYPDAENFLGLLFCPNQSPGSNGSNYCHTDFDNLFKSAAILQDGADRNALYEKMNEFA
jgi:hypothetical protein